VRDLEEASRFYEETLGFRVGARGQDADYVVFEAQTCDLILERVSDNAPMEEQCLVGRFTGLSFQVEGIESLCKTLAARGAEFSGPPERQAWGGTLATLRDPAGNEFQIVEYPGARQPTV
jgi:catechol 2,3-dioxygenase-like lactoylglutathione lyase family enzyme